jgi:serine/threonine protein kinase/Flp pilus assembly protein TadD
MALAPGTRIGVYEIVGSLGAGGMGQVYRAKDPNLGRDIAIKVLPDAFAQDPGRMARFEREARTLASLNHPNIAVIHGLETRPAEDGHDARAIVMELVDGPTLAERIAQGPIPIDEAVPIARQIADALEAAHEQGIVHRDIKASNIMLAGRRHVKILDFGLAQQDPLADQDTRAADKLTVEGVVVGTPHYLAPELLQGARADARSDVWALGVVLYEMLTGRLPFTGSTAMEIAVAILQKPVPPLPASVPPALQTIVERCLAKRPEARYQRAAEIRAALEALPSRHDPRRAPGRWRWQLAAAAVVLAALATAIVMRPWRSSEVTKRLSTGGPASPVQEANEAFELALNFQTVQNDIPRGQQILEHALELDPRFAEALRYHAANYAILMVNGYTNDTSLLYKAEEELRQASGIDFDLLSLPAAYATVYLAQGRKELIPWDRLDWAIRQDPSNVNNRLWRGIALWLSGDPGSAEKEFRAALDLRPLFGPARMFLGAALREEGDLTGGIRELEKVLEQAPNNISAIATVTSMYLDEGELHKARALLEAQRPVFSGNYLWRQSWALLLAVEGRREDALGALDQETLKFSAAAFPSTLGVAEVYAVIGDSSRALEWLERAVRNGDERTDWFRRSPRLAAVRDDPRFAQIIASVTARRSPPPR